MEELARDQNTQVNVPTIGMLNDSIETLSSNELAQRNLFVTP